GVEQQLVDLHGGGRRLRVGEEVADVDERVGLAADRVGDRGVRVAERDDGDARQEVEVALAVGVPHLGTAPALDRQRRCSGHRHDRAVLDAERVELVPTHSCRPAGLPNTIVPMPASVKISSNRTWAIRPSRMWAAWTPLRTAWTQLATLGIIPPPIVPSATIASSSWAVAWRIRLAGSSTSRRSPSMSVR